MSDNVRRPFDCVNIAARPGKPRTTGVTEIRDMGMGLSHLQDLCETAGEYIDILKTASATQRMIPREYFKKKVALCREYGIELSTGGFLEMAVLQGPNTVVQFLEEARDLGYSVVEISSGLLILSLEHKLELVKLVKEYGFKPKPEVAQAYGIKPGSDISINVDILVNEMLKCLDAGAYMVTVESEGLTENVPEINEDAIYKIVASCGLERIMFEAADPDVFNWYIKRFGPDINLFVDETQILKLETVRTGAWGKEETWGRVASFRREDLGR